MRAQQLADMAADGDENAAGDALLEGYADAEGEAMTAYTSQDYGMVNGRRVTPLVPAGGRIHGIDRGRGGIYDADCLDDGVYVPNGYTATLVDEGSPSRPACWHIAAA